MQYQTENSGDFDIYCDEDTPITLKPGERYSFHTGTYLDQSDHKKIELPEHMSAVLELRPRSGLALKFGIDVLAGEIDLDYTHEIKAILINLGLQDMTFNPGDRIVQARWTPTIKAFNLEAKDQRRSGGFGSTGG